MSRLLIILALLALALVACGGDDNKAPSWWLTVEARCAAPAAWSN